MLERLLGEMPVATFLENVFLRQPFSRPHGADALRPLGTWETIERVLSVPEAREARSDHLPAPEPDVLVCRQSQRWEGSHTPSHTEARRLFADGYTLLVRHAERHDPRLADLAQDFARDLGGILDVHIYCTPAGQHGFGWHYDAEDVFVLQTAGRKEYSLRKNTVNPWPLIETLPSDMKFEREQQPLLRCPLAAGDWLYIPNGWWHVARSEEDSISLAVGVLMPAAIDAFDFLRRRLLDSLLWRQRLPVAGAASSVEPAELLDRYREIFAMLGDDLARTFRDEAFVRSYLLSRGVLLDNC